MQKSISYKDSVIKKKLNSGMRLTKSELADFVRAAKRATASAPKSALVTRLDRDNAAGF
jgi:hypothetical protein